MKTAFSLSFVLLCLLTAVGRAQDLSAELQAKINTKVAEIQTWAADPIVIRAVAAHHASLPPEHAAVTQEKWKAFTVLDPFVRSFTKNEAALALKSKKADWVSEAFLSDAAGLKVAFLSKPSGWNHTGKAKHDTPMTGKVWQGVVELDESTGLQQIQVSVPVLDGGKPIGSLVVGIGLTKI